MGWFKDKIISWLNINQASPESITIQEAETFETNVLKNRIWYRGDASELEQFFKQLAYADVSDVGSSRFWAAVPTQGLKIRKIHSGLPSMIVDKLTGLIISDMLPVEFENDAGVWDDIAKENSIDRIFKKSIAETLITGDGAFKVSIDTDISQYPILEFYSGERVEYIKQRGRLSEIWFYTDYDYGAGRKYRLKEIYGKGYVNYELLDSQGKEIPVETLEETQELVNVTYDGDYIMAAPLMFYESPKFKGRGKSIFDGKTDTFDALDETISQWIDALRAGRVQKYIPEDLIPRDPNTGAHISPNAFDNQFIAIGNSMVEDAQNKIDVTQPSINYQAFVETYANMLDQALQGILSPSTLGIDLKKTDNAEAQREKEKATLSTRNELISVIQDVFPAVVNIMLKTYDLMNKQQPKDYVCSVSFGEYASPSFDNLVEVVGKAKSYGIMSTEMCVDELYGDSLTDEQKAEEVERIKQEQGGITNEPSVGSFDEMESTQGDYKESINSSSSAGLNGAQVASLLSIIHSVKSGELSNAAALSLLKASFKLDEITAKSILEDNIGGV